MNGSSPTEAFRAIAAAEWAWRLAEFPRLATRAGTHEHDHRLERWDGGSRAARRVHWRRVMAGLDAIDAASLPQREHTEHAVLRHQVQLELDELEQLGALMPIDADSAFYSYLPMLAREQPLASAEQCERYVERLAAIPRFFADHIELMDEALARGVMQPAVVLQGREAALLPIAHARSAEATPFFVPALARHPAVAQRARRVIAGQVQPAYRRLLAYLCETFIPQARTTTLGAHGLPGGEAFYAARLRGFTTRPLTAQQVHETGLAEVERIGGEMRRLAAECGHHGALPALFEQLRHDPAQYPKSADELLAAASWIAKRVDARLAGLFGRLPRQPFGIAPVPEALAPHYTSGRYVSAPPGGSEPALYWVNTHHLDARALYALPALTLHEAVPGHHLQFALMAEDEQLAPWRRQDHSLSAHTEGWALYAEFLGIEMGLYRTPQEALGRASYEMWRACRLVVDTGLHAFGWSRERAQRHLREHTALSEREVVNEVDRYIGWPGQAVSYKIGEITIRALRRRLEASQGSAFSLRDFHDRVLALGPVPLPTLEQALG